VVDPVETARWAVSMTRDVPAERLYGCTSGRAMKALPYAGQAHGT